MGKGGCLPSTLLRLGREGWHVGKGNEKKNSGAFGTTIYMAGSYSPLVTKWARRVGGGRVAYQNQGDVPPWGAGSRGQKNAVGSQQSVQLWVKCGPVQCREG